MEETRSIQRSATRGPSRKQKQWVTNVQSGDLEGPKDRSSACYSEDVVQGHHADEEQKTAPEVAASLLVVHTCFVQVLSHAESASSSPNSREGYRT